MELVFDSSTLILAAKIDLLRSISEDILIIIPLIVKEESIAKDAFDSKLISSLIAEGNVKVVKKAKQGMSEKLCNDFRIHIGEAEALALAMHMNVPLAVDDLPTVKACKILNRPFTTAIHLLLKVAASGKLGGDTAFVKLEKLAFYGRYSKRIIDDACNRLKEVYDGSCQP
jgi:predicted nucleic acid-binding protein